jgi:RNA polymerase sigma-70 factor (ECF subfamily)
MSARGNRGVMESSTTPTPLRESAARPAAFATFYEQHAGAMTLFFVRRTFDVEAARDLTAETFAEAFESRARFRRSSDREAAAWLYGIARHQLSRYARRGVAGRKAVDRLGLQIPEVSQEDHDRVVELAGLADLRQRVGASFKALKPAQQEALQLRVIDDRPYAEVARRLGVTQATARARVSRALRELGAAIEPLERLGVGS